MRYTARGLSALLLLLTLAPICLASRWVELGNAGVTTDKVMLDADSIEKQDIYRIVDIMVLYPAPRENAHHITMDRHVQRTAFDCAARTFASIRTFGYLGTKRVGEGPEDEDWKGKMRPVGENPMNKRTLATVCGAEPNEPASGAKKPRAASGSGIVVDAQGDILTANHVVQHCKSITVKTTGSAALEASVTAVDPKNDLALIKSGAAIGEPARFRAPSHPARLGETIGVTGYPLSGFLSFEPKATFGQVNSVAGINDDYTLLQFSAPVQPGNSGGPVLDEAGQVIGVVVGEAPLALVAVMGNVPQNINFAVRGEVAQIFLVARGIKIATGARQRALSTEAMAAQGLKSTVFVQCMLE